MAKPDYIDLDKDGDKKEPMKKAAKDAKKKKTNEGLADEAQRAEFDHEVQMARADLYKIAKYAIKLHDMLKSVSEAEGIEGWQQAKITKASDYISSVYHNLDYDMKFDGAGELGEGKKKYKSAAQRKAIHANKAKNESSDPYKQSLRAKLAEKAESKDQQRAAGIALKHKREGTKPPKGSASEEMMKMSTKELEKFAGTKHKGLPKDKS